MVRIRVLLVVSLSLFLCLVLFRLCHCFFGSQVVSGDVASRRIHFIRSVLSFSLLLTPRCGPEILACSLHSLTEIKLCTSFAEFRYSKLWKSKEVEVKWRTGCSLFLSLSPPLSLLVRRRRYFRSAELWKLFDAKSLFLLSFLSAYFIFLSRHSITLPSTVLLLLVIKCFDTNFLLV